MTDPIASCHLIAGTAVSAPESSIRGFNPATGEAIGAFYPEAGSGEVNAALEAADAALFDSAWRSAVKRAEFLEAVASEIESLGDLLIETAMAETGLPQARLVGERGRTCGQLRAFASHLRSDGNRLTPIVDQADSSRQPLPKPGLVRTQEPLGPVVVFGASNFPLAFSTAGGDTASAWAAGCPVVVKAHPSHPNTCQIVAGAINRATVSSGLPGGVFSQLHGLAKTGSLLVTHPLAAGVGFTGSKSAGLALWRLANDRPCPIPVFAEMGSVNPQIFLPAALASRGQALAEGLFGSLTLGGGQFCTNPGLSLGIASPEWEAFLEVLKGKIKSAPLCQMLNAGIAENYERLARDFHLEAKADGEQACRTAPCLTLSSAEELLAKPKMAEEVFGPFHLAVTCRDLDELKSVLISLEGQLTCSLFFDEEDRAVLQELLPLAGRKAGRVIGNGFPTGVEVSPAMQHGGPFPATTDPRFTSVGIAAMERWLRPVCWQDLPF